jgi:undecaprenyl-diphosphatase
LAIAVAAFGLFAFDLTRHGPLTSADAAITSWFHRHTQWVVTQLLLAITLLHSTYGVCAMAAIAAAWLAWRRQMQWLAALALIVPGGLVLNALVKHAFQRARPVLVDPLLTLPTYSFPSGHTAGATVWWGFALALLVAHRPRLRWRAAGAITAVLMIALTALSRVYLGVHYLSDVLAAVAEGVAWLALCFTVLGALHGRGTHALGTNGHA